MSGRNDQPDLPNGIPLGLATLLYEMEYWMRKAFDGFKPPEISHRTALHVTTVLGDLAAGKKARWPEDPWQTLHPDEGPEG